MKKRVWMSILGAALQFSSVAEAQMEAVPGFVADVPRAGYSYNNPAWFTPGDTEATFVAAFVSGDDRVVLNVEQNGRLLAQGSSCTSAALRSRFGANATCVRVTAPSSGARVELRARPLVGSASSNLRASFYRVRPSGEETLLAEQRDVMARPVDFGDADLNLHDEEGARELVLVQLPGGVTSSMMWVESATFLSFFGTTIRLPVLEAVSKPRFSGASDEIIEESSYTASGFSRPVVWAAARRSDVIDAGPLRVVRNDDDDFDGDGLGRGLERAIRTCDRPADAAVFRVGSGALDISVRRCSELSTTNGSLTWGRLTDTDQDGLTDADELLGRAEPLATLPRWGSHPHRKDLFVEVDYYDGDEDMRNGCSQLTSLWTQRFYSGSAYRPSRELIVEDFLSEPEIPCPADPSRMCPAGGGNWDFSTGVDIHLDLGPPPAGVVVDPADTRFGNFGGGNCVLRQRRLLTRECLMGGSPEGGCFRDMHYTDARSIHQSTPRHAWMHYMIAGQWYGQTSGSRDASGFGARQRGTFQHELGHQLGLGHHGPDGFGSPYNDKINYISRMNYRYQDSRVQAGSLLFSAGRLGALDLSTIDECAPFGARGLSSFYDLTDRQLLVCDRSRASCVTSPRYADVDWDADGVIGGGTGPARCPSLQANRAAQSLLGNSVRETGMGTYHVGHAARGTEMLHADAVLSAPSMALSGSALLYAIVDSTQSLRVGVGEPLTDANCPRDAAQVGCGVPGPLAQVVDGTGTSVRARHVALLELRERGRTLIVYQPPTGALRSGYLVRSGSRFVITSDTTLSSLSAAERVALAIDPATATVVALVWAGPDAPIVEARFDPVSETWSQGLASMRAVLASDVAEGAPIPEPGPWLARGSAGLAAFRFTRDGESELVAAYVDSAGAIRFARRDGEGSYRVPERGERPWLTGTRAKGHVVLASNPVAERMYVVFTNEDDNPRFHSYVAGNPTADANGSLHNIWTLQAYPAAFVWDDRSRTTAGALDGMRMSLTARANCDRCGPGFHSDNAYGRAHSDVKCAVPYCQDDRDNPLTDGGFIQTSQIWMPLFEPATARAVLVDHNDYPTFHREICAWVAYRDGAPERCAPRLTPASLPSTDPLDVHPFVP